MKAVPLFLVYGFLGSGKTTFLKNILDRLGCQKRIGIIQNEFSLSKIDSEFLNQSNIEFSLMEVNRGSVACLSLSENIIPTLAGFINREKPEVIFIEASGFSDPLRIIQLMESPLLENLLYFSKSYVIVDASRFYHEVTFLKNIRNQIKHADSVILNKYDKLNRLQSPQEIVESYNYKKIKSGILDINPFADIIPATFSYLVDEELNLILDECSGLQVEKIKPVPRVLISHKKINTEDIITITKLLGGSLKARGYLVNEKDENFALRADNGVVSIIPYNNKVERSEIILFGELKGITTLMNLFEQ